MQPRRVYYCDVADTPVELSLCAFVVIIGLLIKAEDLCVSLGRKPEGEP